MGRLNGGGSLSFADGTRKNARRRVEKSVGSRMTPRSARTLPEPAGSSSPSRSAVRPPRVGAYAPFSLVLLSLVARPRASRGWRKRSNGGGGVEAGTRTRRPGEAGGEEKDAYDEESRRRRRRQAGGPASEGGLRERGEIARVSGVKLFGRDWPFPPCRSYRLAGPPFPPGIYRVISIDISSSSQRWIFRSPRPPYQRAFPPRALTALFFFTVPRLAHARTDGGRRPRNRRVPPFGPV